VNGIYDVFVFLKPEGKLNGTTSASGVKGKHEFFNLTIDSPGVYTFNARVHEKLSSQEFEVNSNVFTIPARPVERVTNYPMIVLIIWFWAMIIFGVIFYISDKDFIQIGMPKGPLHKYCPLLVINNPSPDHLRIATLLKVFMVQFFMFTVLGIFQVSSQLGLTFDCFWESKEMFLACEGLSLVTAFVYNFSMEKVKKIVNFFISISLVASLFTAIRAVVKCQAEYFLIWTELFLVYSFLDLLILQNLIGIAYYLLLGESCKKENPEALVKPLLSPKGRQTPKKSLPNLSLSMIKPPSSRFNSMTPSENTKKNIDLDYIRRTTVSPEIGRRFLFNEDESTAIKVSLNTPRNDSSMLVTHESLGSQSSQILPGIQNINFQGFHGSPVNNQAKRTSGVISPKPPNIRFSNPNK
jgi:hypothetical protein